MLAMSRYVLVLDLLLQDIFESSLTIKGKIYQIL